MLPVTALENGDPVIIFVLHEFGNYSLHLHKVKYVKDVLLQSYRRRRIQVQ